MSSYVARLLIGPAENWLSRHQSRRGPIQGTAPPGGPLCQRCPSAKSRNSSKCRGSTPDTPPAGSMTSRSMTRNWLGIFRIPTGHPCRHGAANSGHRDRRPDRGGVKGPPPTRAGWAYYAVCSKGFNVATPLGATSRTLRVTKMRSCSCAVAASNPSMSGKGSGTLLSAQRLAIGIVIGRILF